MNTYYHMTSISMKKRTKKRVILIGPSSGGYLPMRDLSSFSRVRGELSVLVEHTYHGIEEKGKEAQEDHHHHHHHQLDITDLGPQFQYRNMSMKCNNHHNYIS